MKSVIIATSNQDKFVQTVNILSSLNIKSDHFLKLSDLQFNNSALETGSILDRAKQKAQACFDQLDRRDYAKYLCIIAQDAGTHLPSEHIMTPESKQIAQKVLRGELLKAGDPIHYVYAYAFILLPSKEMLTAETEIPFTYLGNPDNLSLIEGQNTMSHVKAIPGQNVPHSQIPPEVETEYRLKYLSKILAPIIEKINTN